MFGIVSSDIILKTFYRPNHFLFDINPTKAPETIPVLMRYIFNVTMQTAFSSKQLVMGNWIYGQRLAVTVQHAITQSHFLSLSNYGVKKVAMIQQQTMFE